MATTALTKFAEQRGECKMDFDAKNLKKLRRMRKLSQVKLALETGIPLYRISRFECGYSDPSDEEQEKLWRYFLKKSSGVKKKNKSLL
jgi:predicted transcriptional regulator